MSPAECKIACLNVLRVDRDLQPLPGNVDPPGCFVNLQQKHCYWNPNVKNSYKLSTTVCRKLRHLPKTKSTKGDSTWKDSINFVPTPLIPGFSNPTPILRAITGATTRAPDKPRVGCISMDSIVLNVESPPVAAGIFIKKFVLQRCAWADNNNLGVENDCKLGRVI